MEELNSNTTGGNRFNNSNMNGNNSYYYYDDTSSCSCFCFPKTLNLLNRITIGIELPLILIVMIAVFSQVKKGLDAPVYVINLLVSDLFQLCCRIPLDLDDYSEFMLICFQIIHFGVMVSVGFMVCVSCERYLVIAKPLWYRFRRNIKIYVVVCIVVWILPLIFLLFAFLTPRGQMTAVFYIVVLLLPVPLFIFFLVGTIKALSGSLNVPADEKRRIAAIQIVVMLIYTLLYLPIIISFQSEMRVLDFKFNSIPCTVALACACLSPLADTTLYLFSRKTILDKFLASICSCKISNNQETSSTDHESRNVTNTETV